jgi:hypothetical protein
MGWRDFLEADSVHLVQKVQKEINYPSLNGDSVLNVQILTSSKDKPPTIPDRDKSIQESQKLFKERGWIQIYSTYLQENFYLVRSERIKTPEPHYPRYTRKEIEAIGNMSIDELKTLHNAKQIFSGLITKGKGN